MDYEGLIDDNRVLISLIACSMNYETAVTFTYGHFNKVVFAVQSPHSKKGLVILTTEWLPSLPTVVMRSLCSYCISNLSNHFLQLITRTCTSVRESLQYTSKI